MTRILLDLPRIAIASAWTRSLALIALAAAVLTAARVPQGWLAHEVLRGPHPGPLVRWAEWGLTELPEQPLFWALLLLFVSSGVLGALRTARSNDEEAMASRVLTARSARPESAPESMAAALRPHLGEPEHADWDGTKTRLTYVLGPGPGDAVRSYLGLAIVFVTGVYVLQPPPPNRTVARAWLAAEEVRTGNRGVFDLVEGEEFSFFQSSDVYVLRGYASDRLGLGPALQFQWGEPGGQPFGAFWVYENAPPGFDQRHRRAAVGFDVLRAEVQPVPGAGPTARPASWGLILGAGLLMMGALVRLQPVSRVEVVCSGHDLRLELRGPESAKTERLFGRLREAVGEVFVGS